MPGLEMFLWEALASMQSNKLNGADLPVVQRLSPTVQMPVTCNTAPAIAEQSRLQKRGQKVTTTKGIVGSVLSTC